MPYNGEGYEMSSDGSKATWIRKYKRGASKAIKGTLDTTPLISRLVKSWWPKGASGSPRTGGNAGVDGKKFGGPPLVK